MGWMQDGGYSIYLKPDRVTGLFLKLDMMPEGLLEDKMVLKRTDM